MKSVFYTNEYVRDADAKRDLNIVKWTGEDRMKRKVPQMEGEKSVHEAHFSRTCNLDKCK